MKPTIPPYHCYDLMPFGYVPAELLETYTAEPVSESDSPAEDPATPRRSDGSGWMMLAAVGGFLVAIATLGASTAMLAQAISPATGQSQSQSLMAPGSWNF